MAASSSNQILEEISTLQAIYGSELNIISKSNIETILEIMVPCTINGIDIEVILCVRTSDAYPDEVPQMSIKSTSCTRRSCDLFLCEVNMFAATLVCNQMIYLIAEYVRDRAPELLRLSRTSKPVSNNLEENSESEEEYHALLICLEHIHDENRYADYLKNWSHDLELCTRLIICSAERIIQILVLSREAYCCREFLKRLRTTNVDVTTKGVPCKERKLSVVFDGAVESGPVVTLLSSGPCFERVMCDTSQSIRRYLMNELELQDLCDSAVPIV